MSTRPRRSSLERALSPGQSKGSMKQPHTRHNAQAGPKVQHIAPSRPATYALGNEPKAMCANFKQHRRFCLARSGSITVRVAITQLLGDIRSTGSSRAASGHANVGQRDNHPR